MAPSLQAQTIPVCAGVFMLLLARFASRRSRLWWDDWLHLASAVIFAAATAVESNAIKHGLGYHDWDPKVLVGKTEALKLVFVRSILTRAVACLLKLSLLALFIRVFPNRRFRIATGAVIAITLISTIIIITLMFVGCQPLATIWDDSITGKTCRLSNTIDHFRFGIIISCNIIIFILPLFVIKNLGLNIKEKVALSGVFAIGLTVIALSILHAHLKKSITSYGDILYNQSALISLASWEIFASYIVITAPTLGSLARRLRGMKGSAATNRRDLSGEFENSLTRKIPRGQGRRESWEGPGGGKGGMRVSSAIRLGQHSPASAVPAMRGAGEGGSPASQGYGKEYGPEFYGQRPFSVQQSGARAPYGVYAPEKGGLGIGYGMAQMGGHEMGYGMAQTTSAHETGYGLAQTTSGQGMAYPAASPSTYSQATYAVTPRESNYSPSEYNAVAWPQQGIPHAQLRG
ncbi:Hypothetical protein D9617_19g103630 [Elsinoe fawcettii]|nr:Hypothetical protein D9617_19g103630 [Elsinoe fawcettii]